MKRIIAVLIALCIVLSSCTAYDNVQNDIPINEDNNDIQNDTPISENTKIQADNELPSDYKVIILSLYDYRSNTHSPMSGFEKAMKEAGCEFEVVALEERGWSLEKCYRYCLEDESEKKIVVLYDDIGYTFKEEEAYMEDIRKKWNEEGIVTIHMFPYGMPQEGDTHISITYDCSGLGDTLYDAMALQTKGEEGRVLICSTTATREASILHNTIEEFVRNWEKDGRTMAQLDFKTLPNGMEEKDAEIAIIQQYFSENTDCIGMIILGSYTAASSYVTAKESMILSEQPDCNIIAFGLLDETMEALNNDAAIMATIKTPSYDAGYQAGLTAVKALNGEAVEQEIKVPYELLTKDTAQAYYNEHFA